MLPVALLSLAALGLSYIGVGWVLKWAERRSVLAIPNVRSLHDRPIPHGGGLAIVAVTLAGFTLYAGFTKQWPWTAILVYVLGGLLVAVVSWIDDLKPLPVAVRLIAHSLAAAIAILGLGYWHSLGFPWPYDFNLTWVGLVITFVWIVGMTNAYNFMDGIDGIAASQAVVAGVGWAILGWISDQNLVSVLGLLIASSSLGFLGHNWPPARIFMGDVGSAFLGYSLALLPIVAAQVEPRFVLAGAFLVWPFVFDTAYTFIRRLLRGENVLEPHRSHLYQRLVIAGRPHRYVTRLYILLAISGVMLAIVWIRWPSFSVGIGLAAGCFALWGFVRQQERGSASRS